MNDLFAQLFLYLHHYILFFLPQHHPPFSKLNSSSPATAISYNIGFNLARSLRFTRILILSIFTENWKHLACQLTSNQPPLDLIEGEKEQITRTQSKKKNSLCLACLRWPAYRATQVGDKDSFLPLLPPIPTTSRPNHRKELKCAIRQRPS